VQSTPKASSKTAAVATAAPIMSTETSVTPRQRPKACQLNPVNANQFTIGLPPSPSPRNILSSPIDAQHFKAPSKTPDNFNAQFEVDFTNIDNQMPPPSSQAPPASTTNAQAPKPQEPEQFENMFKSSLYPDPFGENDDEIVEIQTNYVGTQSKGQQLFETTVEQQQQQHVTPKVNQHRRYLSDTSGFKRFAINWVVNNFELINVNCSTQSEVGSSGHSASSGDLISGQKKEAADAISRWNPFEDTTPFNQVVTEEEDLFGAEFDKIRQEGEFDWEDVVDNNIRKKISKVQSEEPRRKVQSISLSSFVQSSLNLSNFYE